MNPAEREAGFEARLARLETRVKELESLVDRPVAVPPAPPAPVAAPAAAPVAAPAATTDPVVGWVAPQGVVAGKMPWAPTRPAPQTLPKPPLVWSDLEARLTGRALAWVGGIALVLGAMFFIGLAFTRGWISEELRVVIGLAAGTIAIAVGGVLMERQNRLIGHVLAPVGLAVVSISMVGATRLYDLVPVWSGLLVVLVSAIAAAVIAIRSNSPVVAGFGLVAVLAAPPLMGASPDLVTMSFIAAVLIGTTAVALWRSWPWLPPIAFLLAAPQAAVWILGHPEIAVGLVGIGAFWALNVVAAAGEEVRRRRPDLSPSSASLLLANVAFLVWAGFELLSGSLIDVRGLFLVIVALAHLGIGAYFLRRDGDQSLFGLLAMGTGIAALTMAGPVQFEASIVPVAWVAEATALAWVAVRRVHRYSAAASALLYTLAGLAVLWVYAFDRSRFLEDGVGRGGVPFIDPLGMTLGFFVAGVACGVWIVRGSRYASSLAALGVLVMALCMPVQLDGLWLVAAWSVLMVAGFGVSRWLAEQRDGASIPTLLRAVGRPWTADQSLPLTAFLAGGLAIAHVLVVELPLRDLGRIVPPEIPFTDAGAIAALLLVAAFLASAAIVGGRDALRVALLAAGAVVAYAIPFEVDAWAVSVLWAGLAVAAIGMARVPSIGHPAFRAASLVLIGGAAYVAVGHVAPPVRLLVAETAIDANTIVQSLAALAAVIGAAVLFAGTEPDRVIARWMWVFVGVAFVYAASVAVVDLVGQTMRAGVDLEEVQTRGQVAVSLLWAFLGIVAFVLGLRTGRDLLRQAGLILLAMATVKVFAFDLAALDVAYRVVSLVVLGLVLLASAWLWQRNQPKPPIEGGTRPA